MAEDLLMGIDIGTTGAKCVLVDTEGNLESMCHSGYGLLHLRPTWAEQDPEDWWRATCSAVSQCLTKIPSARDRILALSVSSQGPTLLPLDNSGRPLRRAIIWMDRRAEQQAQNLANSIGHKEMFAITGNRPDCFFVAPRVLWMKTHEPKIFARTSLFAQANGYINYLLTGTHTIDPSHAELLQLRSHSTGEWSDLLCTTCGVEPSQFPEIRCSIQTQGAVSKRAAEATGLRPGTPVMVGTVDSSAAAVEAGLGEPGLIAEMAGTSTVLIFPNYEGLTEPALISEPHAFPGIHLLLGATNCSGASLRWFVDEFRGAEPSDSSDTLADSFDVFTKDAASIEAGSQGLVFLPYLMGERSPLWHTNARGVFFGLSLNTRKAVLVRAILEGVAFSLRQVMEVAEEAGATVRELRSVGGCSRSDLWNQIKADVIGRPLAVPKTSVGAAYGDAILAGFGAGIYRDAQKSLRDLVHRHKYFEPRAEVHERYSRVYEVFRRIYSHLKDDFDYMARIMAA